VSVSLHYVEYIVVVAAPLEQCFGCATGISLSRKRPEKNVKIVPKKYSYFSFELRVFAAWREKDPNPRTTLTSGIVNGAP